MISRLRVLIFLLIFGCLSSCKWTDDTAEAKAKLVFIYCDVTGSLVQPEIDKVSKVAADILERLPPGSRFEIVAIHLNTERSDPIDSGVYPETEIDDSIKSGHRKKITDTVTNLYRAYNQDRETKEINERTCIISGLSRASQFFATYKNPHFENELVFISDMSEHCFTASSQKGTPVRIETQSLEEAFGLAKDFEYPDLSGTRITVLMPGSLDPATQSKRPLLSKLNSFWTKVFDKCNTKINLTDWFSDDIPPRVYETAASPH